MAEISSAEYTQWLAYDQVEPIGTKREDLHIAMLMQLMTGLSPTNNSKVPKLEKFVLSELISPRKKTNEEINTALINMGIAMGAKING